MISQQWSALVFPNGGCSGMIVSSKVERPVTSARECEVQEEGL